MNNEENNRYYGEGSFWEHFRTLKPQEKGYALLLLLTIMPLTYKAISPIYIILGLGNYSYTIMPTLYIIGILLAYREVRLYIRSADIVFYITLFIYVYCSQLFYPLSADFVKENFHDFILYVVPFYFLGLSFDYRKHRYLIHCSARLAIYIHIFWQLCMLLDLVEISSESGLGEQMENAYSLLVIVPLLFVEYFLSHMKQDLFLALIGIFMILFMGTRGPLVIMLIFFATYFILFKTFKNNNFQIKTAIFLLAIIGINFIEPIMLLFSSIAMKLGYSSNTKIFDGILTSSILRLDDSSGRDMIFSAMTNAIKHDNTGLGYGFGSDRLFSPSNGYAHNFELEILVQFGIIGGGLILLFLFLLFIHSFTKTKGSPECIMWFILFCWGFLSLQFSMSWIIRPAFFILLGYCVSLRRLSVNKTEMSTISLN